MMNPVESNNPSFSVMMTKNHSQNITGFSEGGGGGGGHKTIEVKQNYQILGEEPDPYHSKETLLAQARDEVKVKKLQKKDRIIDGYF